LCELGRSQPVILSKLVGNKGTVHVFEVLPKNVKELDDYFSKNHVKNVKCYNVGIWNRPDTIEFTAPYRIATEV
ncbi:MAG: hypothetical protein P8078_08190, partial [bacterium]